MKDEQTGSGLDQEAFLRMFSPGDVIHWKEAIWTGRPQYGRNRLAGEQELVGRLVSFAGKSVSIEILSAEITDARLPGSAQEELIPPEQGKVIRKMIATLLKGNVTKSAQLEQKAPPALKVVVDNDEPAEKKGGPDRAAIIEFSGYTVEKLKTLWPDYYRDTVAHLAANPKSKGQTVDLDLIIVGFARFYAPWVIEADDEMTPTTKRKADAFWALLKEAVIASGTCELRRIMEAFQRIQAGDYKRL